MLEVCVESKKNQVQRVFTEAQRYRGQCVEGPAVWLRGLAFIIWAFGHKGVTCSVLEQSAQPSQEGKNQANRCLPEPRSNQVYSWDL